MQHVPEPKIGSLSVRRNEKMEMRNEAVPVVETEALRAFVGPWR